MQFSNFLKRVLLLDAASCLGMGAALGLSANSLAPLFGLETTIVRGAGLTLLPVGLFILGLGIRRSAPAILVYAVIIGNFAWSIESLVLIGATPQITALGTAFVTAQAAAVAILAMLEWVGVRRLKPAAA